ncbi:hypothetical protein [Pontixanthobacter aquaemixtae]|uniref:Uncharacterized protein n=1 Tax=Pontixanthobacter aquaemixtae TaxID=1958940 RepID=A0A844ZXZ8_9SPHN|nr:hypothetical protein [Pontixanthobacter aquaemixtae]MXO91627.1 hypothetical protein [Pontixanthobacter aquaemixtae]
MAPLSVLALAGANLSANEPELLDYKAAMRCSALHSFYAGVSEDEPEAEALHEEVALRWLTLAMARDGEEGERALEEHEAVVELLIERLNEMEDDPEGIEEFLTEAYETCEELQLAHAEEFDAVEVE